jgi:alpha-tubulin suppressor-like RCC1 family protein
MKRLTIYLALLTLVGCAEGGLGDPTADAGADTDQRVDADGVDAGPTDAGDLPDAAADAATPDANDDAGATDAGGEDTGEDAGVEDAGEDAGEEDAGDPDVCRPACAAGLACIAGSCVDVCTEQDVECGPLTSNGQTIECGVCGSTAEACVAGACVDGCMELGAACGDVGYLGAQLDCGSCSVGGRSCAKNQCASAGWRDVASGGTHTCATRSDGATRCWGSDASGQLGNSTNLTSSSSPVNVVGASGLTTLDAHFEHTCAVNAAGVLYCWGANEVGQIGNSQTSDQPLPVAVPNLPPVVQATTGRDFTCAVVDDGTARCWGNGLFGRLGQGSPTSSFVPVEVQGLTDVVQVDAGTSHACALTAPGDVYCWGFNGGQGTGRSGRLGTGNDQSYTSPQKLTLPAPVAQIAAGDAHTCASLVNGRVYCWGDNADGQIGDGTNADRLSPRLVTAISNVAEISAGRAHTCAITRARDLYCWGRNDHGQVGDSTQTSRPTPTPLSTPADVLAVSCGDLHTCVTTLEGRLYCWGNNDGNQLGATGSDRLSPIEVQ